MMIFQKKTHGAQKHMEVVSLNVLVSLREKSDVLCMKAIMDLPFSQIDYIKQIADEYDESFSIAMNAALEAKMTMQEYKAPITGGHKLARSPRMGSPRQ